MSDAPLSAGERERARATPAFVVWYEDRFGFGEDRDPAFPRGVFVSRGDAEAEAARLGGPHDPPAGKFDGCTVDACDSLLDAHERGFASAGEVRAALATMTGARR